MFRLFPNLLLSLLCLNSIQAQQIPSHLENDFKNCMYLSYMGYSDSALSALDNLVLKATNESDTVMALLMNSYFEIAWESNNCNASIKALDWIMEHPIGVDEPESFADIQNLYGISYKCLRKLDLAYNHFKKATEIDPKLELLWVNLASVQILQKDYAGALQSLNQLPDTSLKDFPASILYKSEALLRLGKLKAAHDLLGKYVEGEALLTNKKSHRLMGEIYGQMSMSEQACEHLSQAKSVDTINFKNHPDNGDFKMQLLLTEMMELESLIIEHCN